MSAANRAPKGTFDVLPGDSALRAELYGIAAANFAYSGYGRIETPIFEETELFARGVGESTDIVSKEMFSFEDQGGRSLTLRPEGTASICRAYAEHGMHKLPQPVKLWYWGPFFRHERPQAGRYRQFTQLGAEVLGSESAIADAEVILLLDAILSFFGVPGIKLQIGSIGTPASRAPYREELQAYLRANEGELSADVRARIDLNPLRAFDAKDPGTKAVMVDAPRLIDHLDADDQAHFAELRSLLDMAGVTYEIDTTLVRGLDYYTRTVFAFTAEGLGAQSEVGGGGRYDGLVSQLGGPETPAVGFAAGIERILLAAAKQPPEPDSQVFVAAAANEVRHRAAELVLELRRAQFSAQLDLGGRSLKGQLKQADRVGADHTVIIEADGSAQLKDMAKGDQRPVELKNVVSELSRG